MDWFYSTPGNSPVGPVERATVESLFRSGEITANTLVWTQGMANWQAYGVVFGQPERVEAPLLAPPVNGEEVWSRVQQRGFELSIGSALSRSWDLLKGNYWPCVGVTALIYLIMLVANQIPFLGLLAVFFVTTQMKAGLQWYFVKQFRGEGASLDDAFSGFRRGFWWQSLYTLIVTVLVLGVWLVCFLPGLFMYPWGNPAERATSPAGWLFLVGAIPAMLATWYIMLCWLFVPLLILDKGLTTLEAMIVSSRVVHLKFWEILGTLVLAGLILVAGVLALFVGVFFVLPLIFAVVGRMYEDAFGEKTSVPALQS